MKIGTITYANDLFLSRKDLLLVLYQVQSTPGIKELITELLKLELRDEE